MRTRKFVLSALLAFALVVAVAVGDSAAAPIPTYFSGENAGLICALATVPGLNGPLPVLIQVNFDPNTNNVVNGVGQQTPVPVPGIPLAEADVLFQQALDGIGLLGGFLGNLGSLQIVCSFSPGQLANDFNLSALDLALFLSPQFEDLGFPVYVIIDTYRWLAPSFLSGVDEVTRLDVFQAVGADDLSYMASAEFPGPLLTNGVLSVE